MDRIVIILNQDQKTQGVNRLFLQQDGAEVGGLATAPINDTLLVSAAPASLQAAFATFVAEAQALFDSRNAVDEDWDVEQPISPDPEDATITRLALANTPTKSNQNGVRVFEMPVTIRHYQGGKHLKTRDFTEMMRGREDRTILVNGVEVEEYSHFYNLVKSTPIFDVMRGAILQEDALGRFNRPVVTTPTDTTSADTPAEPVV